MTESYGYMCPKCLSWWTRYLNKDGVLFCECDVPVEDWIYIYKKTSGNRFFGIDDIKVSITYKNVEFCLYLGSIKDDYYGDLSFRKLKAQISKQIEEKGISLMSEMNLLYIAFKKGFMQSSSDKWYERCSKCSNLKRAKGASCSEGHEWFSCSYKDFNLKESIKKFLEHG